MCMLSIIRYCTNDPLGCHVTTLDANVLLQCYYTVKQKKTNPLHCWINNVGGWFFLPHALTVYMTLTASQDAFLFSSSSQSCKIWKVEKSENSSIHQLGHETINLEDVHQTNARECSSCENNDWKFDQSKTCKIFKCKSAVEAEI